MFVHHATCGEMFSTPITIWRAFLPVDAHAATSLPQKASIRVDKVLMRSSESLTVMQLCADVLVCHKRYRYGRDCVHSDIATIEHTEAIVRREITEFGN